MTDVKWHELPYATLTTFDSKSGRNVVGATARQLAVLARATRSKEKTISKARRTVRAFLMAQNERAIFRIKEFLNLPKIDGGSPVNRLKQDLIIDLAFPQFEDVELEKMIRGVHVSAFDKASSDLGLNVRPTVTQRESVLKRLGLLGARINHTSKDLMRAEIIDSVQKDENVFTLMERLEKVGDGTVSRARALTIARTESRLAYDEGTRIVFEELGIDRFDVVGCVGTHIMADYGSRDETIGNCGFLNIPMSRYVEFETGHHINHIGTHVPSAL